MSGGFTNKPKILRGAFVEYDLSTPRLIVPFQFNPVQLTRNHSQSFSMPGLEPGVVGGGQGLTPNDLFQRYSELRDVRDAQQAKRQPETISFEIRLDATDKLNEGDPIATQYGIAPQLATLELMVHPKEKAELGAALGAFLGSPGGHSPTRRKDPPMILFIWGRKRVLPVNLTNMNITETEFSTDLNPLRATVAVGLTVIEGPNIPYTYSQTMKEAMSALNLANLTDITDIVIPG